MVYLILIMSDYSSRRMLIAFLITRYESYAGSRFGLRLAVLVMSKDGLRDLLVLCAKLLQGSLNGRNYTTYKERGRRRRKK